MAPTLIDGGSHADSRGVLRFCNAFDLAPIRRFYTIANAPDAPRRGWIAHRRETKWFFPLRGVTSVAVEPMAGAGGRETFVLSADAPRVLCVPPGHWFLIEQAAPAEVQVFSDATLGQFPDDDYRRAL